MNSQPEPTLLVIELRRYHEVLTDQGIEVLTELWEAGASGLPADLVAEFVAERLAAEPAELARYRRVIHPRLRVGRSPLLAMLHRHRSELRAGSVETLFRLWNIELRRLTTPRIAGEVNRRLASDEYAPYKRTDDPIEDALDLVYAVLSRFEADLIPTAVVDLTRLWGNELSRYQRPSLVIEGVAARLAQPAYQPYLKPGRSLPKSGDEALRAALTRYPDLVPPQSVEAMFNTWLPLFCHLPAARVAGLVAEKLGAKN